MSRTEKQKKLVSDQISVLIQYMDEHRLFASGKLQPPHIGRRELRLEWDLLTSKLNEIGPAKSTEHWKRCWRNEKAVAQKVDIAWKKALITGNCSNNEPVRPTEEQQIIMSIIQGETSGGIGIAQAGIDEELAQTNNVCTDFETTMQNDTSVVNNIAPPDSKTRVSKKTQAET